MFSTSGQRRPKKMTKRVLKQGKAGTSEAQVAELRQTIAEALRPYAEDGPLRLPAEINFVTATKP